MTDDPQAPDVDLLKWLPSVYDGRMYQKKPAQQRGDAVTDIHEKIAKASGRESNDTARTLALAAIRDGEAWNDRRLPEMGRALNAALDEIDSLAADAARAQDAEADLRSIHTELARLLGPRTPREGVTANDYWIAAVGALLARAEQAERALRYALDCIESPDAPYASGKDIYDAAMMRKAIVRARAALAAA